MSDDGWLAVAVSVFIICVSLLLWHVVDAVHEGDVLKHKERTLVVEACGKGDASSTNAIADCVHRALETDPKKK